MNGSDAPASGEKEEEDPQLKLFEEPRFETVPKPLSPGSARDETEKPV